jgi:hypothetical protein
MTDQIQESTTAVVESSGSATEPAAQQSATPQSLPTEGTKEISASADKATVAAGIAPASQASAYTPNFKYKVKDSEMEFDEWVRPVIKSKEHEEKLRDLYTKAMGLDEIKKDRDTIKESFSKLEPDYKQLTQSLDVLSGWAKNGEYDKFFEALRIPEDKILSYAVERIKYHQLPQEERARIDAARAQKENFAQVNYEKGSLESRLQEQSVKTRELEFQLHTSKPEVSQFVQAFEAKVGMPGAFRQKVIERGMLEYQLNGKDISAEEAISLVMKDWKPFVGIEQAQGQAQVQQVQAATQAVSGANNKPVIPNIQGQGGSPVSYGL